MKWFLYYTLLQLILVFKYRGIVLGLLYDALTTCYMIFDIYDTTLQEQMLWFHAVWISLTIPSYCVQCLHIFLRPLPSLSDRCPSHIGQLPHVWSVNSTTLQWVGGTHEHRKNNYHISFHYYYWSYQIYGS